jgi:hypothetical protein
VSAFDGSKFLREGDEALVVPAVVVVPDGLRGQSDDGGLTHRGKLVFGDLNSVPRERRINIQISLLH